MIENIAFKAEGVFLWAALALKDLVKGVLARDTLDKLKQRLSQLDGTLDGIFAQLLKKVDKIDQGNAANYLLFERDWSVRLKRNLSFGILQIAFASEPELGKEIETLIFAEQDGQTVSQAAVDRCLQKLWDLGTFLNSSCAGLLDVSMDFPNQMTRYWMKCTEGYGRRSVAALNISPLAEKCHRIQASCFPPFQAFRPSVARNMFVADPL